MRVIVAGGREFKDFRLLFSALNALANEVEITEIVSGTQEGADRLGECWAKLSNIKVEPFEPDWATYGTPAGPIRNKKMAEYGDILVLFWDGVSTGSKSMFNEMTKLHKPVKLFQY